MLNKNTLGIILVVIAVVAVAGFALTLNRRWLRRPPHPRPPH